jgi:Zn-dependent protease with chaperone function
MTNGDLSRDSSGNIAAEEQAKRYEKIQNIIMLVDLALTVAIIILFFLAGGSTALRSHIEKNITTSRLLVPLFYGLAIILAYYLFYLLPKHYLEFRLEHKFDLSTQKPGGFIVDNLKSLVLNLVIVSIFFLLTYTLLNAAGSLWWLYASIFWIFFGVLMANLTPVLIIPLFYKLKPLENESLKGKLTNLAQKAKTKILGIFEIEFSRKTKKANAMLAGIGNTKRIILGDTLLNNFSEDEIEAVIAHELGHFYYRHIWKLIASSSVLTVAGFYIANLALTGLIDTFAYLGLRDVADVAAFPLLILSILLFSILTMPLNNTLSRSLERQADRFALTSTGKPQAFIDGMQKLAKQNLADTEPSPIIEFLLHSHPGIGSRVRAAQQFAEEHSE